MITRFPDLEGMGPRDQARGAGRADVAVGFALALAALGWGLAAAPRGYAEGDASELTLALALAGAPHPTGYPIYVLAGHAVTTALHALGVSWPVAANAWSAMGSAVAIFFLHRLALSLAGARLPARGATRALLSSLPLLPLLAQPIWNSAATAAEVTSWHVAWALGAAWLAWRLAGCDEGGLDAAPAAPERLQGRFFAWGVVVGLGAAHHATFVLVAAPLTTWIAARRLPFWRARQGGLAALRPAALSLATGFLLPLLSWGWIAYRAAHPAAFQWPLLEPGLAGLAGHLTGKAYAGYVGGFHPSPAETRLLLTALPWLALSLPAAAIAAATRDRTPLRSFALAIGAAIVAQAAFVFAYRVPDPSAHVLPILALGSLWLPLLAARFAARAGRAVAALAGAALLVALLPPWIDSDLLAKRSAEETDRIVRAAWRSVPFDRGLVFWNNDLYARLRAYQILEGSRPSLLVEHPGVLSWSGPRQRFRDARGFDPWNGATPTSDAELALLPDLAEQAGGLPALDFDSLIRRAGGGAEDTSR